MKFGASFTPRFGVLLLAVTMGLSLANNVRASSRAEILKAIHAVENPHDSHLPGRYGELGAYQFKRSTWRMYTGVPFQNALDRVASDTVAIRHYEWIKRGLIRNGLAPTPYNIALAWNGGLYATIRGRTSAGTRNYAGRVSNLAQEFSASRLASVR